MIRSCRLFFLRRNNFSAPFLTQRNALLKQPSLEFSKLDEAESGFFIDKTDTQKSNEINFNNHITGRNVKYDIFKGIPTEFKNPEQRELFLKRFFLNLVRLPPSEIIKALKMFIFSKPLPFATINTLCDALLTKSNHKFTELECCDLLFCLGKLQYRHEKVVELMVNCLKKNHNSIESPKVIKSLLHSLALLRVRDCELLDNLIKSQLKLSFDIKSTLSALITLSILNFPSTHLDSLIKPLSELNETDFHHSKDYITFIWTCVSLDQFNYISEKHLQKVLSENFIEKFEYGLNGENTGLKLKLLDINTAASLLPSYKGPLLQSLPVYKYFCPSVPKQKNNFLDSVRESIVYIVGKDGLSGTPADSATGLYLDIECRLNLKNSTSILSKPIDDIKLGIILQRHNDICSDGTWSGSFAFKLKVLNAQEIKAVVIPHNEYPFNGKLSEKIVYLRKKIRFAIEGSKEVSSESDKITERA